MKKWYRGNSRISEKIEALLTDIYGTFGWKTRLLAPVIGQYVLAHLKKEETRLKEGWTYEPHVFHGKNVAALALDKKVYEKKRFAVPEVPCAIPKPASASGT
jgi:hypothetical protein